MLPEEKTLNNITIYFHQIIILNFSILILP